MYKFVLCIYLVEARWKWGVMGGSHGGETAALHPAPPSSSCPRSPYFVLCIFPYFHFVFVVFLFCVIYSTKRFFCKYCTQSLLPISPFLASLEFGGRERVPSIHPWKAILTYSPICPHLCPRPPLPPPSLIGLFTPWSSTLLASLRPHGSRHLFPSLPSHFLHSHFALSAAILWPPAAFLAPEQFGRLSISSQSYGSLPLCSGSCL